jgi:DNA-binding response OmpR family regulator
LSLLLQHEFAMAILDVQMPGMNGFELAELMRGTEKDQKHPDRVRQRRRPRTQLRVQGLRKRAVDFLHKPLDIHAVKSKVNVFVDLYRQSKALEATGRSPGAGRREQEALLQQLQSTQLELEQAVRMRDDFMSIVAHEVRTPLNGLILKPNCARCTWPGTTLRRSPSTRCTRWSTATSARSKA